MTTPALSVEGLTKRFGGRTAVDHLDIDLPAGVVAGFVGPNGAGKTTTMAMLLGLVRPTGGSGRVLGEPIADPARYLHRVGALIESPAFYPSLSGRENLKVMATVAGHDVVFRSAPLALGVGFAWAGPFENIVVDSWKTGFRVFPGQVLASLIRGGTLELGVGRAAITAALYAALAASVALVLVTRRDVTA